MLRSTLVTFVRCVLMETREMPIINFDTFYRSLSFLLPRSLDFFFVPFPIFCLPQPKPGGGLRPPHPHFQSAASAASGGSKNVHVINVDVINVYPSQKARKPTFEKWVMHDLTNMKDTQWMEFYVYILGYSASFCLATLIKMG